MAGFNILDPTSWFSGGQSNTGNGDANTDGNNNQGNDVLRQMQRAEGAVNSGFSLLGSLFSVAMWVGVAVLVWNFLPKDWRDSIISHLPEGWADNISMFINQMTGGNLMGDAAMNALERRPVEQVRHDLEGRQIPAPIINALADTQAHWGEFVRISRANGGSIASPINGRVLTAIFRDSANAGLAGRLVASLSSLRPTSGSTTAMPEMVTTALNEFLAEGNKAEFARIVNEPRSRGLLIQALGALAPAGTHLPSSEDLGFLLEKNILTAENLRTIAATAIAHPDQIQASLTGLLSNPEIAARIAALTPEERTRVATIISSASGTTVTADQISAGATTMTAIQTAFGTDVAAQIQAAIAPGGQGPAAAVGIMYTNNAVRANEFLSNTTNLEAINTAMGGGARTDAFGVMLSTPAGRTALSSLVRDLAAISPDTPKTLIDAMTSTDANARDQAIIRFATADARNMEALRRFSRQLDTIDAEPTSEFGQLKQKLHELVNANVPLPTLRALGDAPANVRAAVTRFQTAMGQSTLGAVTLLMDDAARSSLLVQREGSNSASINEVGAAVKGLAQAAPNNRALAILSLQNPDNQNYSNLGALMNLATRIDGATGGEQGSAAEARADRFNAKMLTFLTRAMAGERITETTDAMWGSNYEFTIGTGNNQIHVTAEELSTFFGQTDAQGHHITAGAFNEFLNETRAPAGSPLERMLNFMRDKFWNDKNNNGVVDDDEGMARAFRDQSTVGHVFNSIATGTASWDISNGPGYTGLWGGLLNRYSEDLTRLGELSAQVAASFRAPARTAPAHS